MSLTLISDEVTGWIDLVKKNCALEEEVKSLKIEVKSLTMKNEELMKKVHLNEHKLNIGLEEINPPATKIQEELKCLKLENLELTVKIQLKKMWEFVLEELEKRASTSSLTNQNKKLDVISDQQILPVATNPFEIERVARILMGCVNPNDLLNCRLVCKLWNREVRQHLEKNLTFHIYRSRLGLGQIMAFLEYASSSFPRFRNLKIDMTCHYWLRNKKGLDILLQKHGSSLHKLELNFGGVGSEHNWDLFEFRNIFLNRLEEIRELQIGMPCRFIHKFRMYPTRQVKKLLVNLRRLNIGLSCNNCDFPDYHDKTQVFTDLLQLAPNLETLHWWSQDDSRHFIQSLLLVNPPKLDNLFFHSKVDLGYAEVIANSKLKLKQIYLIELESFELHLVSSAGQSDVTPKRLVYGNRDRHEQYGVREMKDFLEGVLVQYGEVSSTRLLQVFINTLDSLFNRLE